MNLMPDSNDLIIPRLGRAVLNLLNWVTKLPTLQCQRWQHAMRTVRFRWHCCWAICILPSSAALSVRPACHDGMALHAGHTVQGLHDA
jgi:hypothetical protein